MSNDVDFCPLGLQTVHLADVDRRMEEFDAVAMAGVFEAHYTQYTTKIPFLLAILSGWPLFRIYAGLTEALRSRADFPRLASNGICGGAVQLGDIFLAMRMLSVDFVEDAPNLLMILARILTAAEAATGDEDCFMALCFAYLGRAVVMASVDFTGATANGVKEFLGIFLYSYVSIRSYGDIHICTIYTCTVYTVYELHT